jgi:hypothetical protein
MAAPNFITTKGASTLTDEPYYIGIVQHDSVMTKKETYEYLSQKLAFSEANISAAFKGMKQAFIDNLFKGMLTYVDGVASIRIVVKGSFDGSNGPWVKGRNLLLPIATELDPFKSMLSGVIPVNRTGGVTPAIKSVLDNVTGIYDVITGVNAFTIAGTDLGPDTAQTDEYVGVIASDGTLVKAEIVSSGLNTVKAAFGSSLEAGEYTLVVATRSGLGEEFGVKTATRKIRIG